MSETDGHLSDNTPVLYSERCKEEPGKALMEALSIYHKTRIECGDDEKEVLKDIEQMSMTFVLTKRSRHVEK